MDELLIIVADIVIVILAIFATILSVFVTKQLLKGSLVTIGWWIILPIVLAWATFSRILTLLAAIDVLPDEVAVYAPALQVVFWAGVVVYVFGLWTVSKMLGGVEFSKPRNPS